MILPLLAAVLGIVAFLPFNFYPLAFIFLIPLFLFFLREEKLWRLVLGTALFRIIFLFGTVYFTLEPILWTEVILIFLGLPFSVFLFKKFTNKTTSALPMLIFLPFAWTFFDLLQAHFALIPTYIITAGNALGSSPFVGLANIGGFLILTFFVAFINILISAAILQRKNSKNNILSVALIFIILFFSWGMSRFNLYKNSLAYNALPNSFTIISVSTDNTFTIDSSNELIKELSKQKVDLIIFPENIFDQQQNSDLIFQNTARELNTYVLTSYDTFQNENKYNSSILFDPEGNITNMHNKNRLTFIGEYWPFGNWQPSIYKWLREKNPEISDYAIFNPQNADIPGERNLLSITFQKNMAFFATPICLEIHYPSDLKEYLNKGAQFIINPTSNRWIGLGSYHFSYLTSNLKKIEAVWLKLPIVSSGVKDFAGIILPNGEAQLVNYENGEKNNKNYVIFFGKIKY
ncbi:hypothetical protein KKG24_01225 [Patescibacteria group bacterium]|nr:hypothetical protein [Patescibacteria group bacterium]